MSFGYTYIYDNGMGLAMTNIAKNLLDPLLISLMDKIVLRMLFIMIAKVLTS